MPTGTRRLLLAGGLLLALASCSDGLGTAPSSATSAGATADDDASATELIDPSTPASADVRIATGASPSGTATAVDVATGSAPDASASAGTAAPTSAAVGPCAPVVALADAVALAERIDLTRPWPELRATIAASSDGAAQSYLAVVPVAPAGIDDDLRVLADYNTAVGQLARAAASLTGFQAAVDPPDQALLAATTAVDDYMRATCSIGLTGD